MVVSARENRYAAGVQSLMEALACGRPVVATATEGLRAYLDEVHVARVTPGDPVAMRAAILSVLEDAPAAAALARRGHETALGGMRWSATSTRWQATCARSAAAAGPQPAPRAGRLAGPVRDGSSGARPRH